MLFLVSIVILYQVVQSKADLDRLKKHISTTEALHFLISNPHLASKANEIAEITKSSIPIVLKRGNTPPLRRKKRKPRQDYAGKQLPSSERIDVARIEHDQNPTELKKTIDSTTQDAYTSKGSHESRNMKIRKQQISNRIPDKEIFFVHDESVINLPPNDGAPQNTIDGVLRRTKSQRYIRSPYTRARPQLRRSNSVEIYGLRNLGFQSDENQQQYQTLLANLSTIKDNSGKLNSFLSVSSTSSRVDLSFNDPKLSSGTSTSNETDPDSLIVENTDGQTSNKENHTNFIDTSDKSSTGDLASNPSSFGIDICESQNIPGNVKSSLDASFNYGKIVEVTHF